MSKITRSGTGFNNMKYPLLQVDMVQFIWWVMQKLITKITHFCKKKCKVKKIAKSCQMTLRIPFGPKISSKVLYLMFHVSEIQDGQQKWLENGIWVKPGRWLYIYHAGLKNLPSSSISHHFLDIKALKLFHFYCRPLCIRSLPKVNDFQTSI